MELKITTFIEDFEQLFDEVEPGVITKDTEFKNIDEWSSIVALMLIAMCDENYEIRLTGDDIKNSITVEDIYKNIISKG